ncbi:MAG TPA: GDSL-type esterase/lipase family protein [Anaerolineae bacterium]|nr:GDSL-type esterase/lipase family protein [Anaerolineae bacterium]
MRSRFPALVLVAAWCASALLPAVALPARAAAGLPVAVEARALTAVQVRAGQGWAAWEVETGTDVEIAFSRQSGGRWSSPQAVRPRPGAWDRSPSLSVASGGVPWLAWVSTDRSAPDTTRLYVTRWTGLRWAAPEAVPLGDSLSAAAPALAAGPDGTLWLAWVGFDGVDDEIYASSRTDQGWSTPERVGDDDVDPALYDCQPQLAVGQDGRPWLVWTGHQSGVDDEIYASRRSPAGWSPEQMVSVDDEALDVEPTLALDAQGRPWVAWKGRVSDGATSHRRILLSRWEAGAAAWTAEEVVSSPPEWEVEEGHAALTPGRSGRLSLVWKAEAGSASTLAWLEVETRRPLGATSDAHKGPHHEGMGGAPQEWAILPGEEPVLVWLEPGTARSEAFGDWAPRSVPLRDTAGSLEAWVDMQRDEPHILTDPIPNRYLAFGDSITRGEYGGFTPYPALLEAMLDSMVGPSEVINSGVNGEKTIGGLFRIGNELGLYRPQYVLIMEGTNDVTHNIPPSEVQENLMVMVDIARNSISGIKIMFATLIPRKDGLNPRTQAMNEQGVAPAAAGKHVPLCDQWTAFYSDPNWRQLYYDYLHPNQEGLQRLAETFYACITEYWPAPPDTVPPVAGMDPLPSPVECATAIQVSWWGSDPEPGTGVASFDVQLQVDAGGWTDWLLETTQTEASYSDPDNGHVYSFRVRARDVAGNVGDYSAPASVQVQDTHPPESVSVAELPAAQQAPFAVVWGGTDACSGPVVFDVEYRAGAQGDWITWLSETPGTSALFDPADPQYGESYSFRVRARDQVGLWSDWSPPVSTLLALLVLRGDVLTVRHEPVIWAEVSAAGSLAVQHLPRGGFVAYLEGPGDYDLEASREGFGVLPAMHLVSVNSDVAGLELVLPPADDAVQNGGFETGGWGDWQPGGTVSPTLVSEAHTGEWAARLGGGDGASSLVQTLSLPGSVGRATLSLLARPEGEPGGFGALEVVLASAGLPPITATIPFAEEGWQHAWLAAEAVVGREVTLTLSVADGPPIRLDEVSLGSSSFGGAHLLLPLVLRAEGSERSGPEGERWLRSKR